MDGAFGSSTSITIAGTPRVVNRWARATRISRGERIAAPLGDHAEGRNSRSGSTYGSECRGSHSEGPRMRIVIPARREGRCLSPRASRGAPKARVPLNAGSPPWPFLSERAPHGPERARRGGGRRTCPLGRGRDRTPRVRRLGGGTLAGAALGTCGSVRTDPRFLFPARRGVAMLRGGRAHTPDSLEETPSRYVMMEGLYVDSGVGEAVRYALWGHPRGRAEGPRRISVIRPPFGVRRTEVRAPLGGPAPPFRPLAGTPAWRAPSGRAPGGRGPRRAQVSES